MGKKDALIKRLTLHPLMCWDIILEGYSTLPHRSDLATLENMKRKYHWNVDLTSLLKRKFDALIVTDSKQRICWTSNGFKVMTGYTSTCALNKKPSFLQGKESSPHGMDKIREAISHLQPITTSIINYRKDGSAYNCSIEILPLLTDENKLMHFIAIEKIIP